MMRDPWFPDTSRSRFRSAVIATTVYLAIGACTAAGTSASDDHDARLARLQQTVDAHLTAIRNRDLDALLATLTSGDSLVLIFPSGNITTTRQEYVDFHRRWFTDAGWAMEFEPVSYLLGGEIGMALLRTSYKSQPESWNGLLALTFRREDGGYRLVFDQNTRIERP